MTNESCIFRFKNPNGKNSFIPEDEILPILYIVDSKKLKRKGIDLEIDKDLYEEFKTVIDNNGEFVVENIVIDIYNNFSPSALDKLFNFLFVVIRQNYKYLNSIIILGYSSRIINLQSVSTFLLEFCKENKIVLLAINKANKIEVLEKGNLQTNLQFPILPFLEVHSSDAILNKNTFDLEFIKKIILENIRYLYGHFHIEFSDIDFHSNGVLSIIKCLEIENFLPNFKNYIKSFFDGDKIAILPICIAESGVEELAKYILSEEIELFNPKQRKQSKDISNLLILTDFLSASYKIDSLIKKLKKNYSINKIKVLGISKFKNYIPNNKDWLIESDFSEFNAKKQECAYCNHDSIILTSSNFNCIRKSIFEFDTYTFWEFVKLSPAYYSIEHYPSSRTLNHFDFRIICEGLFEKYSYTIANRLINLAKKEGVFSSWIHKALYTTDKELAPLIRDFLEILKIKKEFKIEIERGFLGSISADNPGDQVEDLFEKLKANLGEDLKEWESKNNVLIIDQAAHNFKTLSALNSICKKYNLTLLSIALFINRADPISTRMFIDDFHLLSLYDWPVRPTKFNVCFCKKTIT